MYYSTDKPSREENCNHKPRKTHRNTPSFSSTLLDQIYKSIDGNEQKANAVKVFDEKPLRKQSNLSSARGEESTAKVKAAMRRRISLMSELEKIALQERELLFFNSTNPKSSDAEFFDSKKMKAKVTSSYDDPRKNNDLTIKTKSTVYNKVYANLRKVKQPISPGGKLTSFIQSLFANSNEKKSKKLEKGRVFQQVEDPSSLSSRSRVEMRGAMQRTVGFHHNGKPPLPPPNIIRGSQDDVDGDFSDASSDLFELDHKAMFGKSRFCEELPVYETAYFANNQLI